MLLGSVRLGCSWIAFSFRHPLDLPQFWVGAHGVRIRVLRSETGIALPSVTLSAAGKGKGKGRTREADCARGRLSLRGKKAVLQILRLQEGLFCQCH